MCSKTASIKKLTTGYLSEKDLNVYVSNVLVIYTFVSQAIMETFNNNKYIYLLYTCCLIFYYGKRPLDNLALVWRK